VDSAEADQVGSRRIRFCAYAGLAVDEGVRHYRTTPGALNFVYLAFGNVVIAGCGSYRAPDRHRWAGTTYSGTLGTSAKPSELAARD
jgi:hypothetical protein